LKYGRESRELLHCNFGWGGWDDGYYLEGIFNVGKGPLDTNADDKPYEGVDPKNYDSQMQIITYSGYYGFIN